MSNYIEYNDTIAFHPGYYIKEIVEESGLTQNDFAKRLGTTPKNLSLLIRGEQSLSIDIAVKLSRIVGTSVNYWLNLQNSYDALIAEFKSEEELADKFAEDCLIPPDKYQEFLEKKKFDLQAIRIFANQIERDPGIVLGRLQNDGIIEYNDWTMKPLRHKYRVKVSM